MEAQTFVNIGSDNGLLKAPSHRLNQYWFKITGIYLIFVIKWIYTNITTFNHLIILWIPRHQV